MRQAFKIGIPIMAVALTLTVVVTSAFKPNTHKETVMDTRTTSTVFFDFGGSDQMDQNSYTKRTTQPPSGDVCPGSNVLCGIWATEDPNNPGKPLQADIDALAASYDQDHNGIFDGEHLTEVDFRN